MLPLRSVCHQPLQFTAFVHIPCNLGFYQGAVNGNHASVSEFDLHTGGVLSLIHIFFLGPLGFDSGRLMTPFRKWVPSKLPKKTNNPNPSPTGKIWFGLYWFGAGNRTRTCTLLAVEPKSTESTNSTMPAYFRRMRRCLLPIRPSGLS